MDQPTFLRLLLEQGLCRLEDPDLWFPEFDERTRDFQEQANQAIRICLRCPVRDECKDYGVEYEEYGVWGATTPSDRREIRKERE